MRKTGWKLTDETKRKMSKAKKGKPAHNKGKPMSEEQKQKISKSNKGQKRSDETKRKISKSKTGGTQTEEHKRKVSDAKKGKTRGPMSEAQKQKISEATKGKLSPKKGKPISEQHRQHLSASKQGVPYDKWEAFACEKKYCPKFDEACRESNREKYSRRCFICGKTEKTNGQKLSVHHVDMDRAQGCESNWKLVPLCKSCHAKAHNDELVSRLGYILKEEYL